MTRIVSIVPGRVIAWLCHLANASPANRTVFYELKRRLLEQFAKFNGYEYQQITKECWGDKRDEQGYLYGCGPYCLRCGGTGFFDVKWIKLKRWVWHGYVFHTPQETIYVKPPSVQIHGRIKHADYGLASREAELWLYLVTFQFKSWWKVATSMYYFRPGFYPMCRIQKIATRLRSMLNWRRCWCGKLFPTCGSGWAICKKCRDPILEQDNDVPF